MGFARKGAEMSRPAGTNVLLSRPHCFLETLQFIIPTIENSLVNQSIQWPIAVIDHEEFMVLEVGDVYRLEVANRVLTDGIQKATSRVAALQSRPDANAEMKQYHEKLAEQVRAERHERYLQQMQSSNNAAKKTTGK